MSEARRIVRLAIDDPERRRLLGAESDGFEHVAVGIVAVLARLERHELVIERRRHRRRLCDEGRQRD